MGDHIGVVVAASAALLLIGFSQTAGDARAFAARHHYRVDLNQESVAQGMANAGAGMFQGMPVSTSLSASSLNESSGARTPVASLVTGGLVLATLVVLAPLFSDLPKAVLAAIIIDAVVFGMIDVGEFRRLHRVSRFDFWIAAAALVAVLAAGVLAGVIVGVVLSLGWLVYVATRPPMPLLGRAAGTQVFRDLDDHPDGETLPGVAVLRFDGGLFFATAEALENRVRAIAGADAPARGAGARLRGRQLHGRPGRRRGPGGPRPPRGRRRGPPHRARQAAGAAGAGGGRGAGAHRRRPRPPQPAPGGRGAAPGHTDRGGDVMGTEQIVPRWEWRTFDEVAPAAARLASETPDDVQDSDELYMVSGGGEDTVKVRAGLVDVKMLEEIDDHGLERWRPVLKRPTTLTTEDVRILAEALHATELRTVAVHKRRARYRLGGCAAELTDLRVDGREMRTFAIESEDPAAVVRVLRELGLDGHPNTSYPRRLRALTGLLPPRGAVIDIGTNSVKLHVGERDGTGWRTLADGASVTRLGEGLGPDGDLGAAPIARTVEAVCGMVHEARRGGRAGRRGRHGGAAHRRQHRGLHRCGARTVRRRGGGDPRRGGGPAGVRRGDVRARDATAPWWCSRPAAAARSSRSAPAAASTTASASTSARSR